jgi:hypothetical protein
MVAACSCRGADPPPSTEVPAMRAYRLVPGNDPSAAPVAVSLSIPSGWTDGRDAGTFTVPGLGGGSRISLAALSLSGDTAERVNAAIDAQFEEGKAERTDLGGGRAWVQQTESARVHARVFVPYDGGVVMGAAILRGDAADRLPEIRGVFETLRPAAP